MYSPTHPVWILALVTFVLVLAAILWSLVSTRRRQATGGRTTGLGGPSDPMAGATEGIRSPEEMSASLDAAARDVERPAPANPAR